MPFNNRLRRLEDSIEEELDSTYEEGFDVGFHAAIQVIRSEVEGKPYQKAVRAMLTRVTKVWGQKD